MDLFDGKRLGLALVLSLVGVACAAPPIPNDALGEGEEESGDPASTSNKKSNLPAKKGTTDAPAGETPPGTTPPADTTPPGTTPPATPPAGGQCAAEATGEGCFTCCDKASGGELAKADEVYFTCACDADCASQCGSNMCNGQQPSAACDTCVQQKCEPKADAACTSAACKAGVACLEASACSKKQ